MLRNLILRRAHETKEHKQLAEKNLKKESIIEGIKLDDTLDEESRKAQIEEVGFILLCFFPDLTSSE